MALEDRCVTIAPYFTIHEGQLDEFKSRCERFIEKTKTEPKCLFYGFSFDGRDAHCREGYQDAEGLLQHLDSVGPMLAEALKISDLTRVEVHGPASELDKLRGPLAEFGPRFFVMEQGFRR